MKKDNIIKDEFNHSTKLKLNDGVVNKQDVSRIIKEYAYGKCSDMIRDAKGKIKVEH